MSDEIKPTTDPVIPPAPAPVPPATPETLRTVAMGIAVKVLPYLATVVVAVVIGLLTKTSPVIPPTPVFEPPAFGWVDDPEAVSEQIVAIEKRGETAYFGDTPAGKSVQGDTEALAWRVFKTSLAKDFPVSNQGQVGSCVGFGNAAAIQLLIALQIAAWDIQTRGPPPDYRDLVQEVIYAGSRVQIGKGQIRGDGSVGAWAAQFVQKYGVLDRGKHGTYDLREYSESRCRQWGKSGVPADLINEVKQSPVKGATLVQTAAEAAKALQQGYPIAVCSDVGFASCTRDSDGFIRPSGSWGHCMAIIGYQSGNRPGFLIMNSWGPNWCKGPKGKYDDIPDGSFWADFSVVDRMLKQGDSWAFSDAVGFPAKRNIDWLVRDNLNIRQSAPLLALTKLFQGVK